MTSRVILQKAGRNIFANYISDPEISKLIKKKTLKPIQGKKQKKFLNEHTIASLVTKDTPVGQLEWKTVR